MPPSFPFFPPFYLCFGQFSVPIFRKPHFLFWMEKTPHSQILTLRRLALSFDPFFSIQFVHIFTEFNSFFSLKMPSPRPPPIVVIPSTSAGSISRQIRSTGARQSTPMGERMRLCWLALLLPCLSLGLSPDEPILYNAKKKLKEQVRERAIWIRSILWLFFAGNHSKSVARLWFVLLNQNTLTKSITDWRVRPRGKNDSWAGICVIHY